MENEITRYNHCGKENGFIVCRGMGESENGKYVLYSDYLKLKKFKKIKNNFNGVS